jgi:hypothetical protein
MATDSKKNAEGLFTKPVKDMTDEELHAANQLLMKEKHDLVRVQRLIKTELDRRFVDSEAERIVAGMTDQQKQALAQQIRASSAGPVK